MRTCCVSGCERAHVARRLCQTHYMRVRRRGMLELPTPVRELPCTFAGCTNRQRARGLCATHWRRWRVNGDPGVSQMPRWTAAEDAQLQALPRYPRSGTVVHGYLASEADCLDRSYQACQAHLVKMRAGRNRRQSDQTPAAAGRRWPIGAAKHGNCSASG